MHKAYNVYSILKPTVHIESIAAYDNNVILGTRSGELIMYSVEHNKIDDKMELQLLKFNKNFSKKTINQMVVVPDENLLFILTDSVINVCDISRMSFSLVHSSLRTKGASIFTLDVKQSESLTGERVTLIRLCVAVKRRLLFFYWKIDKLLELAISIDLKDVPKALAWVDGVICVGFKDEYVIYDISGQPKKYDLVVTSSSHSMDPCICIIKNAIFGVTKDEFLVAIDPKQFIKNGTEEEKNAEKLAVIGKYEDQIPLKPLTWSRAVLDIVWDEPYALGRVANCVEVRCLSNGSLVKDTLVQTIPELNKAKSLIRSSQGTIFAAAISELWYIKAVDIPTQRHDLLQHKKFQLAIELTNLSNEHDDVKNDYIRQIQTRFAKDLFANKQFSEAMKVFNKMEADAYDVIRLFPHLIQGQQKASFQVDMPTIPQLEDKDLENALLALIEFLAAARQREIKKMQTSKNSSKSMELLSIIDTTLLKCYLQTNDSLVAPLLRLNHCHLEESEKTLKRHKKFSELIILYQTNGKHKKALELLQSQATREGSSLYGHDRTIHYLQHIGQEYKELIFEFSDWVLRKDPENGLKIFTEDFIEVENLPRAEVLDFLLTNHKSLVIPYLEHIINVWNEAKQMFQNILINQYREKVQNLMESTKLNESENKALLLNMRTKLIEFLNKSENYAPEVVLQDFPTNILLEERAIILGKLKKHEKVLAIYIQILGDIEKATKYCNDVYEEENDIFAIMLKTILNPLSTPPYTGVELHPDFLQANNEVVLQMLNKYATKIDPVKVLPHLPVNMPVYRLKQYMETVIRNQMEKKRHNQILKGLLTAECLRLQEQRMNNEKKSVVITDFSICPVCKKRFTNQSAFVRYPNGEVVHYSCHDKRMVDNM